MADSVRTWRPSVWIQPDSHGDLRRRRRADARHRGDVAPSTPARGPPVTGPRCVRAQRRLRSVARLGETCSNSPRHATFRPGGPAAPGVCHNCETALLGRRGPLSPGTVGTTFGRKSPDLLFKATRRRGARSLTRRLRLPQLKWTQLATDGTPSLSVRNSMYQPGAQHCYWPLLWH